VFYPFLPFSSENLHYFLGFDGTAQEAGWKIQFLPSGQQLRQPQPLFVKLDEDVVVKESIKLGSLNENQTG
jgi:methionyl-tRNA synthetase